MLVNHQLFRVIVSSILLIFYFKYTRNGIPGGFLMEFRHKFASYSREVVSEFSIAADPFYPTHPFNLLIDLLFHLSNIYVHTPFCLLMLSPTLASLTYLVVFLASIQKLTLAGIIACLRESRESVVRT